MYMLLNTIVSCYSRRSVTLSICVARARVIVVQQSSACAFRVGFTPMIITYIRNNKKKKITKKGCTRVRTMCPPIVVRVYVYIYLQCPRQYIDTAAAAARDSAEIITNVYISIIYILCYNIIYPSRENPFGFGCSDNVSPGCIFWYDFMILIFSFTPAGSTTKCNELVGVYFFVFIYFFFV